jgi:hypothetical protein
MTKRAGRTVKLSISIDRDDLAMLKKRARGHLKGNLSAAIAELFSVAKEAIGREELGAWLTEGRPDPGPEAMEAVRAEWRGRRSRRRPHAA